MQEIAASVQDSCRDQNGVTRVETFWQDLRFGARTLVTQRGFSMTVLLTLALAIGANTAVFSVLRGAFVTDSFSLRTKQYFINKESYILH